MTFSLSFEFFPPHTEQGQAKLLETAAHLKKFNPKFFSVTFGAGGTTQSKTYETVALLLEKHGIPVAPHLSCIGATKENIKKILHAYETIGVKRLVALRGDLPSGMMSPGEFQYANELVEYIRVISGNTFRIEVACYPEYHPQAFNAQSDFKNFVRKVKAGANSAITQYFYHPEAYFHFVDICQKAGIHNPIVPGIMPILNHRSLALFSDRCGADLPRWIRKELECLEQNSEALFDFGVDVVSRLCDELIQGGAPGLHFYTLNQHKASIKICQNLKLIAHHVTSNIHEYSH
ncbi:MAG: methylenetetrahydrofolate reductase [NAD(P)H] [Gammaproteobacteria bacterium]